MEQQSPHTLSKVHVRKCPPTHPPPIRAPATLPVTWPLNTSSPVWCKHGAIRRNKAQMGRRPTQTQPLSVCLPGWQYPPSLKLTKTTIQQRSSEPTARFHKLLPGWMAVSTPSGGAIWIHNCCFFKVLWWCDSIQMISLGCDSFFFFFTQTNTCVHSYCTRTTSGVRG